MEIEKIYSALFSDEMEEFLPDGCTHSEVFISNINEKIEFSFILYDTTEEYASANMAYGIVNINSDGEFVSFCEFAKKIEKRIIEEDMKKRYLEVVRNTYFYLCENNTENVKRMIETNKAIYDAVFGNCSGYVIGCINI